MLPNTGIGNDFLTMSPKTQAIKVKIDKLDCINCRTSVNQRTQLTKRRDSILDGWMERQMVYLVREQCSATYYIL